MRELNLCVPPGRRPFYRRLADALRDAIQGGLVRPGEAIPSTRELARRFGVHRHTVMAGLDELVAEGWLTARRGAAYRACATLPPAFLPVGPVRAAPAGRARARFRAWRVVRRPRTSADPAADAAIRFQSGLADLRLFPFDELRSLLADVLRGRPVRHLGYGDPAGQPRLLAALDTYLRRMRAFAPGRIVVTHGSQEGIFLLAQMLLAPGDSVAVEELGYPPAWSALVAAGARLEPVPVDADGIVPEALTRLCRRRRPRLIYLTPLHQYPTTVTLPAARRLAVYETALRYGVPILEDDYDHEYHYRCHPPAPMASNDPAGLILYASTFSKVLYPGARLGYVALPPEVAGPLADLKRIASRQNDGLIQEVVGRWIESGRLERHLRRMRRRYEERRDALVAGLQAAREGGIDLDWRVPDGGMAIWVVTPWDSAVAADRARAAGVLVHAGASYRLRGGPSRHLRLGFAALTIEEIYRGLARLWEACRGLSGRR